MKKLPNTFIVSSFYEVDLTVYDMPIITIYENPSDFPNSFVARLYDFDQWTPYAMVNNSLKAIRAGIPSERFYRLERMVGDDPNILEVWV